MSYFWIPRAGWIVALAWGLLAAAALSPRHALAGQHTTCKTVKLNANDKVSGSTGAPASVFLVKGDKIVAHVDTDSAGKFCLHGPQHGDYSVIAKSYHKDVKLTVTTDPSEPASPPSSSSGQASQGGASGASGAGCHVHDCIPKCHATPVKPPCKPPPCKSSHHEDGHHGKNW